MKKEIQTISSITNGPRQSNIELLRILAMFLVLVVHASFVTTGFPSLDDFQQDPLPSFTKTFFESISKVCVNVFILISGWFGIKPSIKGFCNFLFQCAYFLFSIYIVFLIFGLTPLSLKGIAGCLCLTSLNWFIRAYAALYILSPVLNAFVEKASKRQFACTLVAFFIFQTIWGWTGAAKFIEYGFSTFSFIGLYLLARYLNIYGNQKLTAWGGVFYIISVLLNILGFYLCVLWNIPIKFLAYVNPLVIIGAVGLLLFFNGLKIKPSRAVNWVAKSAFAVFLLHTNPNIYRTIFQPFIKNIYDSYSGVECLSVIFTALLSIYIIAILLDQPRKLLWKKISKHIHK